MKRLNYGFNPLFQETFVTAALFPLTGTNWQTYEPPVPGLSGRGGFVYCEKLRIIELNSPPAD